MANNLYNKVIQSLESAAVDKSKAQNSLDRLHSQNGQNPNNFSPDLLVKLERNFEGLVTLWGNKEKLHALKSKLKTITC